MRISYSSIFRRIRKIIVPEIMNASSSVAVDSTGFKTTITLTGNPINGQRKGKDGSSYMYRLTLRESWHPAFPSQRSTAMTPLSSTD